MNTRLGFDLNLSPMTWPVGGAGAAVGGVMNLGEEYRVNIPTITYGFTPEFLNYFGVRGVEEVDKAVAIMNALPAMDTIDINRYPLASQRINHRAQSLLLLDVKSFALSAFVNQLGLADPTRFVFVLRNRSTTGTSTNYLVIKRNFDPDTWDYSSYINGQLWTYTQIIDEAVPGASSVIVQPVDPLALSGLINAPVAGGISGNDLLQPGGFWTGLTRDDVGGLKYIYRRNNYNVENAPTNSARAGIGTAVSGVDSPWTVPIYGTNATGGVIPGGNTNFVDLSLRGGISKVQFERVWSESVLGNFISNTVAFVDRYITNGVEREQSLVRSQQVPDIVFDAGDLQAADATAGFFTYGSANIPWNSTGDGTTTFGPGTIPSSVGITPSLALTLNSVGPSFDNGIIGGVFFVSEANNLGENFRWASFDGSTEEPFIYPNGANTAAIEQTVLGGGGGGGGGGGALVDVWTPSTLVLLPPGTVITGGGTTGGAPTDPNVVTP
ncbi:MAG: hypothetical protein AB9869_32280 [Verrucomicrobiia bacterium]